MMFRMYKNLSVHNPNQLGTAIFTILVTSMILLFCIIFSFAVLNFYLIQTKYYDRLLPAGLKIFYNLNFVLYSCAGLAIVILLINNIKEITTLKSSDVYENIIRNILFKGMLFWTFFLFTIIVVIILSLKLKKRIKGNIINARSVEINVIGKEPAN